MFCAIINSYKWGGTMTQKEFDALRLKIVRFIAGCEENFRYVDYICKDLPNYAKHQLGLKEDIKTRLIWDDRKTLERHVRTLENKAARLGELLKKYPQDVMDRIYYLAGSVEFEDLTKEEQRFMSKASDDIKELAEIRSTITRDYVCLNIYDKVTNSVACCGPDMVFEREPRTKGLTFDYDIPVGFDDSKQCIYINDDALKMIEPGKRRSRAGYAAVMFHEFRHAWQHETGEHDAESDYNLIEDPKDRLLFWYASESESDADRFAYDQMMELKKFAKKNLEEEEYKAFCKEFESCEKEFSKKLFLHGLSKLRFVKLSRLNEIVERKKQEIDKEIAGQKQIADLKSEEYDLQKAKKRARNDDMMKVVDGFVKAATISYDKVINMPLQTFVDERMDRISGKDFGEKQVVKDGQFGFASEQIGVLDTIYVGNLSDKQFIEMCNLMLAKLEVSELEKVKKEIYNELSESGFDRFGPIGKESLRMMFFRKIAFGKASLGLGERDKKAEAEISNIIMNCVENRLANAAKQQQN